jgi:hypothetical protein
VPVRRLLVFMVLLAAAAAATAATLAAGRVARDNVTEFLATDPATSGSVDTWPAVPRKPGV